jgi:hypothetical protein
MTVKCRQESYPQMRGFEVPVKEMKHVELETRRYFGSYGYFLATDFDGSVWKHRYSFRHPYQAIMSFRRMESVGSIFPNYKQGAWVLI